MQEGVLPDLGADHPSDRWAVVGQPNLPVHHCCWEDEPSQAPRCGDLATWGGPTCAPVHSPGPWAHLQGQPSADAEACPAGGKPEVDRPLWEGERGETPRPHCQAVGGRRPSNPRGTGLCGWNTHHLGLADPLRGLDGPVQAGLAQVDVLCVRVTGQQPQQGPHVHVVIIIHVAEPPGKRQAVRAPCGGGAGWGGGGRSRGRSPARGRGHRWAPAKGRHSLSPGFDEAVVLHGHLAGQRLAAVGGRAVSIDHVACGQGEGL